MKKVLLLLCFLVASSVFSQEGFEGTTFPPAGWITASGPNNGGVPIVWTSNLQNPCLGTKMAFISSRNTGAGNLNEDWLITNQQTITSQNMQLRFMARQSTTGDQGTLYQIRTTTSTSQADLSSYTVLKTFTESEMNASPTTCEQKAVDDIPVGTKYIAFVRVFTVQATAPGQHGDRWFIDNVLIAQKCPDPEAPSNSPLEATCSTAKLFWHTNGGTSWEIEVVLHDGNNSLGQGQGIANYTIGGFGPFELSGSDASYTVTGLLSGRHYVYYVRSVCDNNVYGNWIGPFHFSTIY